MKRSLKMSIFIDLYKKMYLIRKVENVIIENYFDDEMKTPMHMSKGSEHISVGVCSLLSDTDQIFTTYRSHAPYIAKGGNIDEFFSEMYGKENGICSGKAGSMHICSLENGHMSSSAIVASNIPVAVGAAFANKVQNNGKIVVVFFGDGAIDEGNFWESINMACLWKLPILFICEDNNLAVFTSKNKRQGYHNISDIMDQFNMTSYNYRTNRVDKIYNYTRKAIDDIKKKKIPSFIRFEYYRYLEHVGINEDNTPGYRNNNGIQYWDDPVKNYRIFLKKRGIDNVQLNYIEEEINNQVYDSLNFAKRSNFSNVNNIYKDVFYE